MRIWEKKISFRINSRDYFPCLHWDSIKILADYTRVIGLRLRRAYDKANMTSKKTKLQIRSKTEIKQQIITSPFLSQKIENKFT